MTRRPEKPELVTMTFSFSSFPGQWDLRWEKSGVSRWIIDAFFKKYKHPPEWLTELVIADDKLCGIGPLTLGSDKSCADHDILMLLDREGYRLEPIPSTQLRFLSASIAIGVVAAATAVVALPKGIIGAIGGTVIQVARDMF